MNVESPMMPRSRRSKAAGAASLLTLALSVVAAGTASAGGVNFDNVPASPSGTLYLGNTFAAQGVIFRSVSSPNFVFPGLKIHLTNVDPRILVLNNSDSVSAPNFAAASGVFNANGPNDVLMTFGTPVTSVQVVTDQSPGETPDVVRLIALAPAGPGAYVVVKVASKLDNATTPPGNVLSLDLQGTPASFVLFQVTTEAEGFDSLEFSSAPDCSHQGKRLDPDCYEVPPLSQWVPVGCEIVDCCEHCPGDIMQIDWVINVQGEKFDTLVLQFADLPRETAANLRVEGNATWEPDLQQLEVQGPGQVILRGFTSDKAGLRWSAASPRMTLERIDAPAAESSRALRVKVQQKVGDEAISDSTLVFGF